MSFGSESLQDRQKPAPLVRSQSDTNAKQLNDRVRTLQKQQSAASVTASTSSVAASEGDELSEESRSSRNSSDNEPGALSHGSQTDADSETESNSLKAGSEFDGEESNEFPSDRSITRSMSVGSDLHDQQKPAFPVRSQSDTNVGRVHALEMQGSVAATIPSGSNVVDSEIDDLSQEHQSQPNSSDNVPGVLPDSTQTDPETESDSQSPGSPQPHAEISRENDQNSVGTISTRSTFEQGRDRMLRQFELTDPKLKETITGFESVRKSEEGIAGAEEQLQKLEKSVFAPSVQPSNQESASELSTVQKTPDVTDAQQSGRSDVLDINANSKHEITSPMAPSEDAKMEVHVEDEESSLPMQSATTATTNNADSDSAETDQLTKQDETTAGSDTSTKTALDTQPTKGSISDEKHSLDDVAAPTTVQSKDWTVASFSSAIRRCFLSPFNLGSKECALAHTSLSLRAPFPSVARDEESATNTGEAESRLSKLFIAKLRSPKFRLEKAENDLATKLAEIRIGLDDNLPEATPELDAKVDDYNRVVSELKNHDQLLLLPGRENVESDIKWHLEDIAWEIQNEIESGTTKRNTVSNSTPLRLDLHPLQRTLEDIVELKRQMELDIADKVYDELFPMFEKVNNAWIVFNNKNVDAKSEESESNRNQLSEKKRNLTKELAKIFERTNSVDEASRQNLREELTNKHSNLSKLIHDVASAEEERLLAEETQLLAKEKKLLRINAPPITLTGDKWFDRENFPGEDLQEDSIDRILDGISTSSHSDDTASETSTSDTGKASPLRPDMNRGDSTGSTVSIGALEEASAALLVEESEQSETSSTVNSVAQSPHTEPAAHETEINPGLRDYLTKQIGAGQVEDSSQQIPASFLQNEHHTGSTAIASGFRFDFFNPVLICVFFFLFVVLGRKVFDRKCKFAKKQTTRVTRVVDVESTLSEVGYGTFNDESEAAGKRQEESKDDVDVVDHVV